MVENSYKISLKWVEHNSPEWHDCVALRTLVLRKPLGLVFTDEQLAVENADFHLTAYSDNNELLGCLILSALNSSEIKMRQVAVHPKKQGQKIGAKMVAESERFSKEKGFKKIVLHARETAVPFYLKLSYIIYGDMFTEVGIPHRKMMKVL